MTTEKSIQPIKYSVCLQRNPQDENEPKKAYGNIQYNGTMNTAQLAKHLKEHGSLFSRGTIIGVMADMVDCMKEHLLQGFKIDLDDLGTYRLSMSSTGASTLEKFSSANITKLGVSVRQSRYFRDLRDNATFEKVATRAAQKATLAAQVKGETSADWTPIDDDDNEGGEG